MTHLPLQALVEGSGDFHAGHGLVGLFDHLVGPLEERGGLVTPSAVVVLRLIAGSNFVGCATGDRRGWRP
jgi:hypothetical protein